MNPITVYDTRDFAYPYRLRGTNQGTDLGLLYQPPGHRRFPSDLPYTAGTVYRENGIRIGGVSLHNRSGAAISVGIGVRLQNHLWLAGQWTDPNTFTEDTVDAQDPGTADFPLETLTANSGFVILSRVPINAISVNVTTATSGAAVRAVSYSSGTAGHTWAAALTNLYAGDAAATGYATGESLYVWALPIDHTPTTADNGLGLGIPKGYYAVRVQSTTAPLTTAGSAQSMEVFRLFHLTEALADNGVYEAFYGSAELRLESTSPATGETIAYGDGVVAFFGGTADPGNRVTLFVRSAG